jgi:hypothetical protein
MGVSVQLHTLCHFSFGERAPGGHWTGGCVGPRASVVALETWYSPLPCQHLFLLHRFPVEVLITKFCVLVWTSSQNLAYYCLTVRGIFCVVDTLFTSGVAKQKPQTKRNKPTASGSSHTAAAEDVRLFEDPLMVVTKKWVTAILPTICAFMYIVLQHVSCKTWNCTTFVCQNDMWWQEFFVSSLSYTVAWVDKHSLRITTSYACALLHRYFIRICQFHPETCLVKHNTDFHNLLDDRFLHSFAVFRIWKIVRIAI